MPDPFFSLQEFPGDGVTTEWEVSFAGNRPDAESGTTPYIDVSDIDALEITPATSTTSEVRTERVVTAGSGPNKFVVSPAVVPGHNLRIFRNTQKNYNLVDYQNLQVVSEFDLDLANRQLVFVAQESFDQSRLAYEAAVETRDIAQDALVASTSASDAAATAITAVAVAESAAITAASSASAAEASATSAAALAATADATATAAQATADGALVIVTAVADDLDLAVSQSTTALAQSTAAVAEAGDAATDAAAALVVAQDALDQVSSATVQSVNGKSGVVTLVQGDLAMPSALTTNEDADELIVNQAGTRKTGTLLKLRNWLTGLALSWSLKQTFSAGADLGGNVTLVGTARLGIGATPSSWSSGFTSVDLSPVGAVHSSSDTVGLSCNLYGDGANWRAKTTAAGSQLLLGPGRRARFTAAPAASAGAIAAPVTTFDISEAGAWTNPANTQPRSRVTRGDAEVQTSGTVLTFTAETFDTTSSMSPASGVYVAPVTGLYLVVLNTTIAADAADLTRIVAMYVNGTITNTREYINLTGFTVKDTLGITTAVYLTAGQTLDFRCNGAFTANIRLSQSELIIALLY